MIFSISILFLLSHQFLKYIYHSHLFCNFGFSFGTFSSFSKMWIIIIISLFLLLCLVQIFSLKRKNVFSLEIIALLLFFGGGVTNFFDRLIFGCVYDYFSFFNLFYWNIADAGIFFGALLFLCIFIKKEVR
ncbi:MAG: signal peptidase II [Candidatus Moraniibacteriota bacterium]|nr:MAG: signal peptidase II [Candidatus Moranbacteria bacterium]